MLPSVLYHTNDPHARREDVCPIRAREIAPAPAPARRLRLKIVQQVSFKEWQALRLQVIARDNQTCQYCRQSSDSDTTGPDGNTWHIDHIMPLNFGGLTMLANLQLACKSCNQRKGVALPNDPWKARSEWIRKDAVSKERYSVPSGYIYGPRAHANGTRDAIWAAFHRLYRETGQPIRIKPIAVASGFSAGAVRHHLRFAAASGLARMVFDKAITFEPLEAVAS